jgi:hypothetical protein
VGKSEENRPLGRFTHSWEDNVIKDLKDMGREDEQWIHLAQDKDRWWAVVSTVKNLRVA